MAFGCFKLAVVLEGIHARFLQHKTVGEGFEREGFAVPVLIERAHQMLDRGLDRRSRMIRDPPGSLSEARRPALAGPHNR